MDPRFQQTPTDPLPAYEEKDPIETKDKDFLELVKPQEDEDEFKDAHEDEKDIRSDVNKLLDKLELPNYNDVEN